MPRKKTQEEFIAEVTAIWGDKLDFSKAVYINNHTNVEVKCNECGETFTPKPDNLLHHHGCPSCGGNKKMTREMFIKRAKEIHGDKYDYSKVEWVDKFTEVTIICPVHGEFKQIPKYHFYQQGCKECSKLTMGSERLSLKRFLEKAKEVHGDRYDYSLIKGFRNNREKLPIRCREHGVFMQSAHAHIDSRQGCPECGKLIVGEAHEGHRLTNEEFVSKAMLVHGKKYDYSLVDYKDTKTPVVIICRKHGEFKQKPNYHLNGNGCQQCFEEKRGQSSLITFDEFVKRAQSIHGDVYIYSPVDYRKTKEKIKIYCKKCGKHFSQTPHNHLIGQGCPVCSESHLERKVRLALERRGIKYERSKKFEWLRFERKQHLDFYLPKPYNVAIECQGFQHFVADERSGEEGLALRQKMDKNKFVLCRNHGIRILYFSTKEPYLPEIYLDKIYLTIAELIEEINKLKE